MMVDRVLTRLKGKYPDLEVEKIDILTNFRRTINEGIRMIPALKSRDRILSGIILNEKEIEEFLSSTKK